MEYIADISELGTFAGIAVVVGLIVQFFIKDRLQLHYFPEEGEPTPRQNKQYRIALYSWAGGFGIVIGLIAMLALVAVPELTVADGVMAVLNGLAGAVSAVGGYEVSSTFLTSKN